MTAEIKGPIDDIGTAEPGVGGDRMAYRSSACLLDGSASVISATYAA
jgi:hypothetical protein